MTVRWITPMLGTAPADAYIDRDKIRIVDVRDLVDKEGNSNDLLEQKISMGADFLAQGQVTVVCCDYGISRSNAVAAGILSRYENIAFEAAAQRVMDATGEKEIKIEPMHAVRRALGGMQKTSSVLPRVLVTGGSGFLGQHLIARLAATTGVFSPSRETLDLERGATHLDLLAVQKQTDCIVHLASPRVYTSNVALGQTLSMLRNVIDVCVASDLKLVYLSSWEVYSGYRASHLLADESLPLFAKGPYGDTKYLAEMLIRHSRQTRGLRCTVLRSSPVYGSGSDKPKFIYNFIEKIQKRETIVTHRYRNGFPSLDLLYIDDLMEAILAAVHSNVVDDINIGTGVATSTMDIAKLLQKMFGDSGLLESTAINSDTAGIAMDSSKAAQVLGWKSATSLEAGLMRILKMTDARS